VCSSDLANDGRGYGKISIKHAFEKSSNVFSQIIFNAYRSEPEAFLSRLDRFGLTKPLGIDLPGEASPKFNRPGEKKGWSRLSLPSMGIGYEVLMTPLQILNLYNAVANNGKMMKPQFVHEIRRNGEVIKKFEPIVMNNQICSPETVALLKSCMEGVMKNGTGKQIKSAQFTIAGKTGTAEIPEGSGYGDYFATSFLGMAPAEDPQYAIGVMVYKPKQVYTNSQAAVTSYQKIFTDFTLKTFHQF
jgi:cell division protein FtsI (penicillin-binding protein 3)